MSKTKRVEKMQLAEWTAKVPESEIRRLLKYRVKYYFAGGLPGNQPLAVMKDIITKVANDIDLKSSKHEMFNYGPTAGIEKLRRVLTDRLIEKSQITFPKHWEDLVITTGSQQGLYGLLKTIINPGDLIITPRPTYLGFIGAVGSLLGKIITVPSDAQGIIPEGIEAVINQSRKIFFKTPKVLYVQTYSENPTGLTLSSSRRKKIFDICQEYGIFIIEDAAYKEIQFGPQSTKPMKYYDKENESVAYLGTTSKEAAVFRLGYSIIPDRIKNEFIKLKGYIDLCTPNITQEIAAIYYEHHIDRSLIEINAKYKKQSDAMKKAIDENLPGSRTDPTGGFFIWHKLPNINTLELLRKAIDDDVLFVPGNAFYPSTGYQLNDSLSELSSCKVPFDDLRFSFSDQKPNSIHEGIRRLGKLLK